MGNSAYLALNELGLDGGPGLRLGSIGEKVHDDGTTRDGLVNVEQVLASNPAILLSILPGLSVLSDTNDDVEAVVTEVKTLAVALRAIANEGQSVVLEVLKKLLLGPIGTLCRVLVSIGCPIDPAAAIGDITHHRRPPCGQQSQWS